MCLYPRIGRNPKYVPNKKNGGIIPPFKDPRVLAIAIGCGECIECMRKKKREWKVRLTEELKTDRNCTMVTLTFSNESITKLYNDKRINNLKGYALDNAAATLAVELFYERWRKKYGKPIKRWLVTELGHKGTENIHLHGILWSKDKKEITEKWQYGHVHYGWYMSERTINYSTKYIMKQDPKHKAYKPIILVSNGMGKKYTDSEQAKLKKETYTDYKGYKTAIPIYYRNKIFTENEREQLWIEKLNQQTRYINGQKVDTSTEQGKEQYKKLLEQAQRDNIQMGYSKGSRKWAIANYELERRILLQEKRKEMATPKQPCKTIEALPQTPSYVASPAGQGYMNQESNLTGLLQHIRREKDI